MTGALSKMLALAACACVNGAAVVSDHALQPGNATGAVAARKIASLLQTLAPPKKVAYSKKASQATCKTSVIPATSISGEDALAQCPQGADGTGAWNELKDAEPSDTVFFGRSPTTGSCACKFCEGIQTTCTPDDVLTGKSATDDTPTCFHFDEEGEGSIAGYECGFLSTEKGKHLDSDKDVADMTAKCLKPKDRKEGQEKVVFLVGDSHAQNLVPALTAATHGKAQLRMLFAPGIGFCDDHHDDVATGDKARAEKGIEWDGAFARYRKNVLDTLKDEVKAGDIVVVHNYYDVYGESATCTDSKKAALFYEKEIVGKITAHAGAALMLFSDWTLFGCEYKNQNVYVEGSEDEYEASVPTYMKSIDPPHECVNEDVKADERAEACFYKREWDKCAIKAKPMELRQPEFQRLADDHPGVYFHDLYGLFVDPSTDTISMNVPGTNVLWMYNENIETAKPRKYDGFSSHLNSVGALYLWPYLCSYLDAAWKHLAEHAKEKEGGSKKKIDA